MAIDQYSPCPGGCNKKIKFCCPDLLGDLDKITRMLEGDQRLAALEYIRKIEPKFPGRACLMTFRYELESEIGQHEAAEATAADFGQKFPDNPIARMLAARSAIIHDDLPTAISLVQDALELSGEAIPVVVYETLGDIALALLSNGQWLPGNAHIALMMAFNPRDERATSIRQRFLLEPAPLVMRDATLHVIDDNVVWQGEHNHLLENVWRGRWRHTLEPLAKLAARVNHPLVWWNVAVLHAWLGRSAEAVEILRKIAEMRVSHDLALRAEMLAQSLDTSSTEQREQWMVEFHILDIERLMARLASSPTADAASLPPRDPEDTEPPPRASFLLLDRPVPEASNSTADTVSIVLGQVDLYGRQTDRDARAELLVLDREGPPRAKQALLDIGGDAIEDAQRANVVARASESLSDIGEIVRFAPEVSMNVRRDLSNELARRNLLERWPTRPRKLLDGKSAREASADMKLRLRVEALFALLDEQLRESGSKIDVSTLRESLAIAPPEPIHVSSEGAAQIGLERLHRIVASELDDTTLIGRYFYAVVNRARTAMIHLGKEILARPSTNAQVSHLSCNIDIAQALHSSPDDALRYLDAARRIAKAESQSTAVIDLLEVDLRLTALDLDGASAVIRQLLVEHGREPVVQQSLAQILMAHGLVPTNQRASAPAAVAEPQPASALWTPDAPQAPAAGATKSGLWVPGMD